MCVFVSNQIDKHDEIALNLFIFHVPRARERNREHAKRSRVRKKFLLESLQKSVTSLQEENEKLRGAIRANLGADEAKELLSQTESSSLIASNPGDATKVCRPASKRIVDALCTSTSTTLGVVRCRRDARSKQQSTHPWGHFSCFRGSCPA